MEAAPRTGVWCRPRRRAHVHPLQYRRNTCADATDQLVTCEEALAECNGDVPRAVKRQRRTRLGFLAPRDCFTFVQVAVSSRCCCYYPSSSGITTTISAVVVVLSRLVLLLPLQRLLLLSARRFANFSRDPVAARSSWFHSELTLAPCGRYRWLHRSRLHVTSSKCVGRWAQHCSAQFLVAIGG